MNYTDIDIKTCYESGIDDIVEDFYEPVLGASVKYDRIAGFFSSSSLAVAARGMEKFIGNNGKMRLIASPKLNADDAEMIKSVTEDANNLTLESFGINLNNIENEFVSNHVKALGWMLGHGLLEMKLAIVINDDKPCNGIFHQKVGVMEDNDGHRLSFSGSINESATAWVNNDEEFKVFKEWTGAKEYFEKDLIKFDDFWNGRRENVYVFDLPTAVKRNLIEYSNDFDLESISVNKYKNRKSAKNNFATCISLFPYQNEALVKWRNNNYSMLFEMATGTGKTRTAIAGIDHLFKKEECLVVVVSCPQNTLSVQWEGEIKKLNVNADCSEIIDGTNLNWRSTLYGLLMKNASGFANHCIIYTTHTTSSSNDFTKMIREAGIRGARFLFIGDEVHWLGAEKRRAALLETYRYRIGLSATPSRWFDDNGTRILESYFGNCNFEFTIKEALVNINPLTGKHFLVNYYYHISHVQLNYEEANEYSSLTHKLIKLYAAKGNDSEKESLYNKLLEKRADIIKNAESKYDELNVILDDLMCKGMLENTIVFVSPQQIQTVKEILANKNIIYHKLTQEEGTKKEARFGGKSEREIIIQKFKSKDYKVLVAIKCLDEGIDIPSASIGILMSSSTNPREYVQRIGRIIRQDEGKRFAHLYDICVDSVPLDDECIDIEKKIRSKEQQRMREIAENAINSVDALEHILELN